MAVLDEIVKRVQQWREAHPRAGESRGGILACDEFRRIESLPTRALEIPIDELSAIYRRPGSDARLLPLQAAALYDFLGAGGLLGALPVGSGKTLLSFLLCHGYKRPLLVLPANLIAKTMRERAEYARDWVLPRRLEMVSYERLSRVSKKPGCDVAMNTFLEDYAPDIIICDEAHKIKNAKTAVHRRMRRYVHNRKPAFVALSGTLIGEKLMQWAPIAAWALGDGSPAPTKWATQNNWAGAIDPEGKTGPGALRVWMTDDEPIQIGYGKKVRSTAGVISQGGIDCAASILIDPIELPLSDDALAALVLVQEWELPDGSVMVDPLSASRAERQEELECYYQWVKRPPQEWIDARKGWGATQRRVIATRKNIDTELQARQWVDANDAFEFTIKENGADKTINSKDALAAWRDLGPTFVPETKCVWINEGAVRELVRIAGKAPAIVWIHHKEIGAKLQSLGLPYYGAGGLNSKGESIESELGNRSICASIQSNHVGRNLQRFSRAIVAEIPDDPKMWEQLIGRFHRTGQRADEVIIRPVLSTERARAAFERVKERALNVEAITGIPMKLLSANETGEAEESEDE